MGENVVQQVWNFDPQSPGGGNWERLWGREGRFPCTHIFTPKVWNCKICFLTQWVFALKFQLYGETWFNRSETLTHSHPEEEIKRGHEEERKGSPIPIFPPPYFEYDWGLLYWTWGARSDWFLVNRRGFEPQGFNQRGYGQICSNWVRELACFLLDFGNKVADSISCSFLVIVGFWQLHLAIIG